MERGYQYGFSQTSAGNYDVAGRENKAKTMLAVMNNHLGSLGELKVLNVGGSSGIIDNYLADYFESIKSIDIDKTAIQKAKQNYQKKNLEFNVADALNLPFEDQSFDVVICSHVYEHVPDPTKMMDEIYRVMKNGGACYFAAGNRLMLNEPHYNLPLLSVIPRPLAHVYMRIAGKGKFYYEKHLSYWGLDKLVEKFEKLDYTKKVIYEPDNYNTRYMLKKGGVKEAIAKVLVSGFYWATPGYIWILKK